MENSLSITKRERDYILFNIRGFFRHYKLEQNINKITIDISNIQSLEQEVNNLLSQLNEYKEEFNTIILNNQSRQRLFVNRRKKSSTKSTDIAIKKMNERKQKIRMKELKYDLNKSNLTMRPKTPDVSQILYKNKNKERNKKFSGNIKNNILENYNNLGSKSFIQQKKYHNRVNTNINSNNTSHRYLNTSNISKKKFSNNNINIKNKIRDNSIDNKSDEKLNYTINKFPKGHEKIKNNIFNGNYTSGPNKLNIISLRDISPNSALKNKLTQNKTKNIIYDRYHSSDVNRKKKSLDAKRSQNIYKISSPINPENKNKKFLKLKVKKRTNMKTPSPYRKYPPLLIDHDTIIRNKNKKINYNGRYHSPSFANNKINNTKKTKEKLTHNKIKSEILINKKDITKEQEKKLDEIINYKININQNLDNDNDYDINKNNNILDLSQKILQNLEYMDNPKNNNYFYEKEKNNRDNLFISNFIESLFLAIKLGYFTPFEKIKLLLMSKELYFKFEIKDVINDYINYYQKQIDKINNRINKYDINTINKPFIPRKTGINSLNFITKNEEQRLINESSHDYVIKIFKIILIFLKEDTNIKETTNIFEFLFKDIYNKNNVSNIKDLFIKNFVDKIPLIDDARFNTVNDIIKEVPDLLSPSTLLSYNRNVSYLIFFLSELYNYFSFKTNDDVYYYKIRNDYFKLNEYINKINKLKTYL